MKLNFSLLSLCFILLHFDLTAQHKPTQKDTITAREILTSANISANDATKTTQTDLVLTRHEAIQIAKPVLQSTYGRLVIFKERPFHTLKLGNHWVLWGTLPKRFEFGGTFEMVISSQNGNVEFVTHGK